MNPAALKTNIGDLPRGRRADRQQRCVHRQQPEEGGLRDEPADRRLAQAVQRLRDPDQHAQHARARRPGHDLQAGRPDQELLRPGPDVLAVRALAWSPTLRWIEAQVRRQAGHRRGEHPGAQGGLRLRRDDRDVPHALQRRAGQARARDLPQHHRQRGDRARLRDGRPSWPSASCSTARIRSRPRATSCTSWRATRTSASRRSRPRTRSRPSARRSARATAARWA